MVKQSANFCPSCGGGWKQRTAQAYTAQVDWNAPATWQGGWHQRPKSPRKRSPGRPKGGKSKDQAGKEADKGQGKGKEQAPKGANLPTAPTMEALPKPPAVPVNAAKPPPTGSTTTEPSPEQAALQQLLSALSGQKEHLPEGIRQLVEQQSLAANQDNAKHLHRTVTAQASARRELQKTRNARSAFMQSWSNYISQLRDLLEEQVKTQQEQLDILDQQEMQWAGRLQEESATLARLAAAGVSVGVKEEDEADDMEVGEQRVDDAIALEQELQRQKAEQQQAARQLLSALTATQEKAVEEAAKAQKHAEGRQASRTPRRGRTAESVAVDSSPEMQDATAKPPTLPAAALKPPPQ